MTFSQRLRTGVLATGLAIGASVAMTGAATAATPSHREIKTVKISIGRVLAATNNHVLYLFEKDGKNVSHCDKT
jgi:predicted lipoprotein with Yx(FWY)xxD motif